jgi:hypothetical protein
LRQNSFSLRRLLPGARVIDALLDLPFHLRERLASALESGLLGPSPTPIALGSVLGSREGAENLIASLLELGRLRTALPARQCPGELAYRLLMLLVPDFGKVAGDLELHTLVQPDLPRTFLPETFVKIGDRRAQRAGDLK